MAKKKKEIIIDELMFLDQISISIAGNSYNIYNEIYQYIDTHYHKNSVNSKEVLDGLVENIVDMKKLLKEYLKKLDSEVKGEQKTIKKPKSK